MKKGFDSRLGCQLADPGAVQFSFVPVNRSDRDDLL